MFGELWGMREEWVEDPGVGRENPGEPWTDMTVPRIFRVSDRPSLGTVPPGVAAPVTARFNRLFSVFSGSTGIPRFCGDQEELVALSGAAKIAVQKGRCVIQDLEQSQLKDLVMKRRVQEASETTLQLCGQGRRDGPKDIAGEVEQGILHQEVEIGRVCPRLGPFDEEAASLDRVGHAVQGKILHVARSVDPAPVATNEPIDCGIEVGGIEEKPPSGSQLVIRDVENPPRPVQVLQNVPEGENIDGVIRKPTQRRLNIVVDDLQAEFADGKVRGIAGEVDASDRPSTTPRLRQEETVPAAGVNECAFGVAGQGAPNETHAVASQDFKPRPGLSQLLLGVSVSVVLLILPIRRERVDEDVAAAATPVCPPPFREQPPAH
jgi:hypothetical protein